MENEIRIPKLPESVSDGTIAVLHKKVGDFIRRDENFADIETDKVVLEVPSPVDGFLKAIIVKEGDAIISGQSIAILTDKVSTDGEKTTAPPNRSGVDEQRLLDVLQQVDSLIGLERAKQELKGAIALIRVAKRRLDAGLASDMGSFHAVFAGNPGTGKTTFARLYAEALKSLGAVSEGHVVEVTRADFVAGFVGQTALKTRDVIDSAIGGVLFIDEAYALVNDVQDSFGREALAELIKAMEDKRTEFAVVLAGYTDEMEDLQRANPGLKSRIVSQVQFDDYSNDDLLKISGFFAKSKKYEFEPGVYPVLEKEFQRVRADSRSREFGNAREARNIVERMIRSHAIRIATNPAPSLDDLVSLKVEDIDK